MGHRSISHRELLVSRTPSSRVTVMDSAVTNLNRTTCRACSWGPACFGLDGSASTVRSISDTCYPWLTHSLVPVGGSELAANARAAGTLVNTNMSAAIGGLTWVFLDYRHNHKFSAFAFCSGAVAGLVGITPAAGFVPCWSSPIVGLLTAAACYLFVSIKVRIGLDDSLDCFGVHGIGGIVGNILTGVFASKHFTSLDGVVIEGGWIDGHFMQVPVQLAASCAGFAWSFTVTYVLLFVMNKIPYLNLRLTHDKEVM